MTEINSALDHPLAQPIPDAAILALRDLIPILSRGEADREVVENTPGRYYRALMELTEGYAQTPATILLKTFDVKYDEMIIVRDIGFWSLCEHHLLPFQGEATVGYIPSQKIV